MHRKLLRVEDRVSIDILTIAPGLPRAFVLVSLSFIIAACNSRCGKVMFSQACVSHSVHGGRGFHDVTSRETHPPGCHPKDSTPQE